MSVTGTVDKNKTVLNFLVFKNLKNKTLPLIRFITSNVTHTHARAEKLSTISPLIIDILENKYDDVIEPPTNDTKNTTIHIFVFVFILFGLLICKKNIQNFLIIK